ncbi:MULTISPECIES: hypothetical protein [unclassified Streptosporangium]|uniref:hypothetical protein n=1 Tax=unclassified Streptosporangium TaxID=2632669 RepID=UPI002E2994FF|nr:MULTISPECIES: hypothetical protein [unclassified Streptosporangium]
MEFTLESTGTGTTLTMVESGFAQLPDAGEHKVAQQFLAALARDWDGPPAALRDQLR